MSVLSKVERFCRKNAIVPILILFFVISSVVTPKFLTPGNLRNVLTQAAINGIMAVCATFLIINGYRDLSVGTLMGLSAALVITLQSKSMALGIVLAFVVALLVGFINGFLVVRVGINTFIATLATMLGCRGILFIYTNGQTFSGTNYAFAEFGSGFFLGLSNLVWVFIALLVVAFYVLRYTMHGRNTYAVGGNPEAASNAGINVARTTIANFMICSLGACLGGILMAARSFSSYPTMGWPNTHFIVIVMVVLGGTKLSGGVGNVLYTVGGALAITIYENVLILLEINPYVNPLLTGLILIGTLYLDSVLKVDTRKLDRQKKTITASAG